MNKEVAVVVTNKVQYEIVEELKNRGVSCEGIKATDEVNLKSVFSDFKKIVLPFPSTRSNLSFIRDGEAFSDYLSPEHTVVGGMIRDGLKEGAESSGVKFFDYFANEAYVLKNAYLTSQGALRLLLENTEEFIVGKKVLITGFGRIGKSLAFMLKSLGMKVFVAVRSEEAAAEAHACGFDLISFKALQGTLFYYDFIFNTVPSTLFSYRDISHMSDSAIYFELASSPFGAERNNFDLLGKNYVHGGALPGRYYPKAVAKNVADFILKAGR